MSIPYPPPFGDRELYSPHQQQLLDERVAEYESILKKIKHLEEQQKHPEKQHILGYN